MHKKNALLVCLSEHVLNMKVTGLLSDFALNGIYIYIYNYILYIYTVEAGYNAVPGIFKIASLYAACVLTEAPDITNSHHASSLHSECWL